MKKLVALKNPDFEQTLTAPLLGQAIKARRTQSKLRLEDAAALCGVAKQTLMNIEHGNSKCQLKSVLQVCASLGIKIQIAPWKTDEDITNEWA